MPHLQLILSPSALNGRVEKNFLKPWRYWRKVYHQWGQCHRIPYLVSFWTPSDCPLRTFGPASSSEASTWHSLFVVALFSRLSPSVSPRWTLSKTVRISPILIYHATPQIFGVGALIGRFPAQGSPTLPWLLSALTLGRSFRFAKLRMLLVIASFVQPELIGFLVPIPFYFCFSKTKTLLTQVVRSQDA